MYKIILSDNTVIDDLDMNCNNFVSSKELFKSDFDGKLSPVLIVNKETGEEEYHEHMTLIHIVNEEYTEGNWYFVLRDLTEEELWKAHVMGSIDYIAMMSDIDL